MKLSPEEKETIILYNEAEDTANVYTHDRKLIERLKVLQKKNPTVIIPDKKHSGGSISYTVPKKLVTIRAPYSEERRKADSERAKRSGIVPPQRSIGSEIEQ